MLRALLFSLFVALALLNPALAQSVNFESVLLNKNAMRNGEKGLEITSRYTLHGYKDKKVDVAAYFFNHDNSKLMDFDGTYKSVDGQVSTSLQFVVDGENIVVDTRDAPNFLLFIPYKQLHLSQGDYHLKVFVEVFLNENTSSLGKSNVATVTLRSSDYQP